MPVCEGVLLAHRKAAGKSQQQAAGELGIAQAHLSRLELGRHAPSPELLDRIAALYGVTVDDLVADAAVPQ